MPLDRRVEQALALAQDIEQEDVAICEAMGEHGADLLEQLWQRKSQDQDHLNILTHCNAGALATVDWGTALSVVYHTVQRGVPVHVWVDETRPRNQGAALTCWELGQADVPHTLIVDNAGGHLMQEGQIDVCVVGSDRTARNGDVCNKVGSYLNALDAYDNGIPFYVALPLYSIDFSLESGLNRIPIEERDSDEVTEVAGIMPDGLPGRVRTAPPGVRADNPGFDVTPARLVTALITEGGAVRLRQRQSLLCRARLTADSAWRPSQGTASKNVKMKVKNGLATMAPGVDDIAEADSSRPNWTTILLAAAMSAPSSGSCLLSDH